MIYLGWRAAVASAIFSCVCMHTMLAACLVLKVLLAALAQNNKSQRPWNTIFKTMFSDFVLLGELFD